MIRARVPTVFTVGLDDYGPAQWVLLGIAAVGTVATLALVGAAGTVSVWMVVAVVASWVWLTMERTAWVPTAVMVAAWVAGVHQPLTGWSVAFGWLLLVVHAALALSATAPAESVFDHRIWRTWGRNVALAGLAGTLAWVLARSLQGVSSQGTLLSSAAALVAVGALALLLRALTVTGR
ncbi:MAG TPA: hypothetical protein VFI30_03390 [Nocardioidaceae bacterium]|nr:hypothetical protein [Nocardioidaceae bacterium]